MHPSYPGRRRFNVATIGWSVGYDAISSRRLSAGRTVELIPTAPPMICLLPAKPTVPGAEAIRLKQPGLPKVITGSAITDFDGAPGRTGTPTCPVGTDDTFANFGADVDLTAPGMCVHSTWRLGSYNTISGTSMASPHVAGAAALYLAGHPGRTPAAVKQALQAAGTLDWQGNPDGTQEPLVKASGF